MNNKKLPAEFRSVLEQWAEDNLKAIGIFRDKISDYDKWQNKIIEQLRSVYSDKAIELFLTARDNREISSPDAFAKITGSDGHTMEIFLRVKNGIIVDSSFRTDGCKGYIVSGGMIAEMIRGKSLDSINKLTSQDIIDALGGLPEENKHCAMLTVDTLKEAVKKNNTASLFKKSGVILSYKK